MTRPTVAPHRRLPSITDELLEGTTMLRHPLVPSNAAKDLAALSVATGETTAAQDLALFNTFTYLVTIVTFVEPCEANSLR
jgi:hypothetical protein